MKIGIDIGGTNTDVVLVGEKNKIVASFKETTTASIEEGVVRAISALLTEQNISPQQIHAIFMGSTHATNAILEGKDLLSVGLIRIAGNLPLLSPGAAWPQQLRSQIIHGVETIPGGYECNGEPISSFDKKRAREAIDRLLEKGVQAISIVGVFSPIHADQEKEVQAMVKDIAGPDFPVSISFEIGGIGFIERENATLLNSSLKKVVKSGFQSLSQAICEIGIQAQLFMIHNDGSIMDMKLANEFPIFTISAGQTNSFRGAVQLASIHNAIVIDVGGTSSDIGLVENGYPKRSCHAAKIGGVKLQFAMPDVVSLAIGGGTIIKDGKIGPESISRRLRHESQCFSGSILTLTDIACLTGYFDIQGVDTGRIAISKNDAQHIIQRVHEQVDRAVNIVRGKNRDQSVIVVGGAALLLKNRDVVVPEFADVANAYGAALSEISSTIDIVTSLEERQKVLEELKAKAVFDAIGKGADKESTRIVNVEVIPYAYSKNSLARVIITASGTMKHNGVIIKNYCF